MLLEQFQVVIDELKQLDSDFLVRLELESVLTVLGERSDYYVNDVWRILEKSNTMNELAIGSHRRELFLSLMLHLKLGLTGTPRWEKLTALGRKNELKEIVDLLNSLINKLSSLSTATVNPVASLFREYKTEHCESELVTILTGIQPQLTAVSLSRPLICEKDCRSIEDIIGYLRLDIDDFPETPAFGRGQKANIVPTRGNNKELVVFLKVMANWTKHYLGKRHDNLLCQLAYSYIPDKVPAGFDEMNVRDIFKSSAS